MEDNPITKNMTREQQLERLNELGQDFAAMSVQCSELATKCFALLATELRNG